MALSGENTHLVYMACGLHAGGATRYRYTFQAFAHANAPLGNETVDYSSVKTVIDAQLAAWDSDQETLAGTLCTTYKTGLNSAFRMTGDLKLSDEDDAELARRNIVKMVGVAVESVPWMDGGSGSNTVSR